MRLVVVFLSLLVWSSPALAQRLVPNGQCALIVAARPTLPEVQLFQQANPHLTFGEVYLALNGVYAISLGLIVRQRSAVWLESAKARAEIPQDSYCALGSDFVRIVHTGRLPATIAPARSTDPFRADLLQPAELRFLQARLALAGTYAGLLDGQWGNLSQRALIAATGLQPGAEPSFRDAARVIQATDNAFGQAGWRMEQFPSLGRAMMLPMAHIRTEVT